MSIFFTGKIMRILPLKACLFYLKRNLFIRNLIAIFSICTIKKNKIESVKMFINADFLPVSCYILSIPLIILMFF